jgi:Uma2 family endonuclease
MRACYSSTMHGDAVSILTPLRHLPLRIRPAGTISDDALYEFCRMNRDLRIERTRDGELVIMSPTGAETGRRNFGLIVAFGNWALADASGVGFDSSTGFILPNGAERSPDLAWVKRDRWDALTVEQRRKFAPLCPDFVVELRSPSDDLEERQAKMREYLANGAALGWLIDPDARRVWIHRPSGAVELLDDPVQLSGEPLLPGLVLALSTIW